ncbi:ATP-binding protein [Streptomyces sp. YIM S03343]
MGASSAKAAEEETGTVTERAPEPQLRRRLGRADLRAVSESRKALRELLCEWGGGGGGGGGSGRSGAPESATHGAGGSATANGSAAVNGQPVSGLSEEPDASEVADVAVLLTSELVTNALIHTDHDAVLTATVGPGGLHVEVRDFVARRPRLCVPDVDDGTHGRGLLLVQSLADAWGVRTHGVGKSVWFELDVA